MMRQRSQQKVTIFLWLICLTVQGYASVSVPPKAVVAQETIDWDQVRIAFDAYLREPNAENAKAFLATLPKKGGGLEKGDELAALYDIYDLDNIHFPFFKRKVLSGDRYMAEAAFRLLEFSDGGFAEELRETLGTLIENEPKLFLELLREYQGNRFFERDGYALVLMHSRLVESTKEEVPIWKARVKALESVKDEELRRTRDLCINILKDWIKNYKKYEIKWTCSQ